MSQASSVRQVQYTRRGNVFMPYIQSSLGDLFQEYQGTSDRPETISPDYVTLRPMLSLIITSSLVSQGVVVPTAVDWYFNGTKLTFGPDRLSTNSFGGEVGHFENVPYAAGMQNYYALRLRKNLVKASGGAACLLKAEAAVGVGNTSDRIQAIYSIPITVGVGNAKRVTIMAGDNHFFTLTDQGQSCLLKSVAWLGSDQLSAGLTYKWYALQGGVWQILSGQTGQTLAVTNNMVNSSGQFMVEVFQNGTLIGTDVQTVVDASDPLDILSNPDPASETIEEGSGGTVTYAPVLVKRGSTAKFKDTKFFFTALDAAGNVLNPSTARTAQASFSVTEGMCRQASGNVSLTIMTEL